MLQSAEGMQRSIVSAVTGVMLAVLFALLFTAGAAQVAYADELEDSSLPQALVAGDDVVATEGAPETTKVNDRISGAGNTDTTDANANKPATETKPATEVSAPASTTKPEKKPTKAGWMKDTDGTWYYFSSINAKPKTGWLKSGGNWYWLQPDKNGAMATNTWITDTDGKRYYFNKDGIMAKGWLKIGGGWYFTNASGAQVMNGWVKSGGKWYWLQGDKQGLMAANQWITDKGKRYYLTGSGAMKTGWVQNGKDWYYANSSGAQVANGWIKTGGKWYWLQGDKQGLMFSNGIKTIGSAKYSFASNGAMRANCQVDLGDGNVGYAASSGAITRIGIKKDGKLVLTNASGQILTGWQKLAGKWFYGEAGTGIAKTGWLKTGGVWYYLDNSGAMVTGTRMIDGKMNLFASSGKWLGTDSMATKAQGYSSGTGWLILVDRSAHRVGIFSGSKGNWSRVKTWSCVTGAPWSQTITGVYRTTGMKRTNLSTDSRARWCTQISGNYFFHSILASNGELGTSASHGCIRLAVSDAYWIYSNIGAGTTVVIYN